MTSRMLIVNLEPQGGNRIKIITLDNNFKVWTQDILYPTHNKELVLTEHQSFELKELPPEA